ncbi:ArsR family transcriptional regulator [Streptomyces sp. NPDC048419]|uniref:ArsR family transcriptional regulator n=1 Tax=Streptomyces sp. NPDC048419 TaxID=3365547 RepID=UPI003713D389
MDRAPEPHAGWTFATNHSRVLAVIAEDRTTRVRDIADRCRLTQRTVQKRHPADAPATGAELLAILTHHECTHRTAAVASTRRPLTGSAMKD